MDYAGTCVLLTSGRSIFFAVALAALSLTAGCRRAPPVAAPDPLLDVTFGGCAAVVGRDAAVVCELGESRALRLVAPKSARDVVIEVGGAAPVASRLASRIDTDAQRTIHHVDVPAGAERIVVRALVPDGRQATFSLPVATARKLAWAEEAKGLRAKGELAKARALAAAHVEATDGVESATAKGLLARIALSEGRADDAFPLFRAAIIAHRKAGRISDAVDDSFALAFALHQRSHRYDEARAALDGIVKELPLYPEGRVRDPYYRGILAAETGDPRHALALLTHAESRAHDLGMTRLRRNARAAHALELQVLGRLAESVSILKQLDDDPEVKGCERVEIANDLGWGILLANEAAPDRQESPRATLQNALDDASCSDAYLRSFALGNLARYELSQGSWAAAEKNLAAARAAVKEPRGTERLAWLDLEARILLARREPDKALARFDEERALARAGLLLDHEWSALIGRSDALEALGRRGDAVAALLAAEDVLDRTTLLVPLGEGRGSFVAERSRSARGAVDLLVGMNRNDDAVRVARRSRTRVLASVERASRIGLLDAGDRAKWEGALRVYRAARETIDAEAADDWKLPADALARATEARKQREQELRVALEAAMAVLSGAARDGAAAAAAVEERVASGDLELVIHPGKKDWIAFASDGASTTSHRVPDPMSTAAVLAPALFDPIATRIVAARRVRVRAFGAWERVDVHALPFKEAPLIEQVAVDYPLGLRGASREARFDRRAVVVGDPNENLGGGRAEATLVAKALEGQLPSKLLVGSLATSKAVASELPRAGLFHYAGHAVSRAGGVDGWSSQLSLASGGYLSVGDLLALAPAPRKAVLLGCDASRSFDDSEGLSLAHALIAAGAEEVLAPVRKVDDRIATKLAESLYAAPTREATLDLELAGSLAAASRAAIRAVRKTDPTSDWQEFRVLAR